MIILVFAVAFLPAFGQLNALSEYSLTSDSIAASTTKYMYLDAIPGSATVTISPYVLNVSGTTGVNATVEEYVANAWVALTASNHADLIAATDTVTLTTGTAGRWAISADARKYRVKFTADGTTQVSIIKAAYNVKP